MAHPAQFYAAENLSQADELAALDPRDPFLTSAYIEAIRRQGWKPRLFFLREQHRNIAACAGYLREFPGCTSLDIPSASFARNADEFWRGLEAWCRSAGVRSLNVNTDTPGLLNGLAPRTAIFERSMTYVSRLGPEAEEFWWPSHQMMAAKAMESGVRVRSRLDRAAQRVHVRLALRTWPLQPGLPAPGTGTITLAMVAALIDTGAAELHVSEKAGRVIASVLVLVAGQGAIIHSLGLTAEGNRSGAGHQLLAHLSRDLRGRGMRTLTLGDADESHAWVETLVAGFATGRQQRESMRVTFGPAWSRKLGTLVRTLRERPVAFLPAAVGRLERYVAYVAQPEEVPEPENRPEFRIERLDYTRLAELARQFPDAVRHHERAQRFGYSAAFGVFVDGELAHISWLVLADDDVRNAVRNVKVRPGEAEIGPCSTFPAYRGRGLYPYIIRSLCRVAADRGIQRVFMITSSRNISSQRGIEKAGFRRCGSIYRFVVPYLGHRSLTLRGHRIWLALHRPHSNSREDSSP